MSVTPDRIAQIRAGLESEHRTHDWSDDVIEELLTAMETSAATPAEITSRIAEDVRALNYATMGAGLAYPSDVYDVVGSLDMALMRLPQALTQMTAFLVERAAQGGIRMDDRGDVTTAVARVDVELERAAAFLAEARAALQAAHSALSGMAAAEG